MNNRGLLIGVWLTIMAVAIWWLFVGMGERVRSDLTLFMPEGKSAEDQLLLNELREGPASRLMLLAIQGGDVEARTHLSKQLADQLRSSRLFTQVQNGGQQLDAEEWQQLHEYRYLLSPRVSADTFSVGALRAALTERLQELASPLSSFYVQLLPSDPTGEFQALGQDLQPKRKPAKQNGVWTSADGSRVLLLVETKASGYDLDAQQLAVEKVRSAFTTAAPNESHQLLLSGPGVYGVMSRELIRKESTLLSVAASVLVTIILFIGYRSPPLILLATLPVATAVVAGTAAVTLWFGTIHGITLAFGITLLGMTIDYPMHLFSHIRQNEAPLAGLRRIWPTLRLSALTSGAAFAVMMTTGFGGLGQLGLLVTTGLATATLFTRYVLPRLPGVAGTHHALDASWPGNLPARLLGCNRLSPTPDTRPRRRHTHSSIILIIGTLLLASVLWLSNQGGQIWEDDLGALSPVPRQLLDQDRELRRQLSAPEVSHLLTVSGSSVEEVLQRAEQLHTRLDALVEEGVIGGSEILSRLLPSIRTQLQRRDQLPDDGLMRDNLNQALEGMPFRPGTFDPFLASVKQARSLPPLTADQIRGTLLGSKVNALLRRSHDGWLLVIPLSGVSAPEQLAKHFASSLTEATRYINLKSETSRFVVEFRDEALYRLAWGLAVLVIVLLVALRSPRQVIKVLLPVAIALIVDTTLLTIWQPLSLFHLISLLLVVGISLDYSLFVNRPYADPIERCRTNHSLTLCLVSTAVVFGLLAFSKIPVLNAIGSTVVIGVISGYVAALALREHQST